MNDTLKNTPEFELNEDILSETTGGIVKQVIKRAQLCKGGCGNMTTESLGYCKACQKKYAAEGWPLIL